MDPRGVFHWYIPLVILFEFRIFHHKPSISIVWANYHMLSSSYYFRIFHHKSYISLGYRPMTMETIGITPIVILADIFIVDKFME